jgi:hypothetical protein
MDEHKDVGIFEGKLSDKVSELAGEDMLGTISSAVQECWSQ